MVSLRFDYRDIFKSARLAFSFQRLWIQFVGLFFGYLGYVIFTYVSLLVSGYDIGRFWARFGLVPTIADQYLPWFGWVLFIIGAVILVISWLVTSTAVARAVYMSLKGNTFYTWREAFAFALKKKGSIVSTPIAIFAIAFFTALGGFVIGLLGKIPIAGELGMSLFTIIWFLASLFLVFVIITLFVSFVLTPAILATTDDDAFEGIFQSFSIISSQPWRFILYEVLLLLISVVGLGIFAFFAKHAWLLMTTIFASGMGDKFIDLSNGATYLLQTWIYPFVAWSRAILCDYSCYFSFARDVVGSELPVVMTVSAYIFAIFLVIIGGIVASFPLAIFNGGNSLIFLILKKKKDDENLLEREDKEEEEEEVEEEKTGKDEIKEEGEKRKETKKKK